MFLKEYFRSILEAEFHKLLQDSDPDSGSEAGRNMSVKFKRNKLYFNKERLIMEWRLQEEKMKN